MKANILTLAITLTVGIILAGSLLVPVLSDAADPTTDFSNKSGSRLAMDKVVSAESDIEIIIDHETGTITTNGVEVPVSGTGNYRPLITDTMYIYITVGAPKGAIYEFTTSASVYAFNDGISDDMVITLSGDSITIAYEVGGEAKTVTSTFEYALYPKADGEYVNLPASTTIYTNSVDDVYFASRENSTALVFGNGNTATMNGTEVTPTYTTVAISGIKDTFKITGFTIPISSTDVPFSGTIICKATVVGHNDYMDPYATLILAIPILIIIGLLLVAVRATALRD